MTQVAVSLPDIKFILIFTFSLYLYFRKKHKVFAIFALAGFVHLFLSISLGLRGGIDTLLLAVLLAIAYIISFKDLIEVHRKGIDAKAFLKFDMKDFIVLMVLIVTWAVIKSI